MPKVQGRCASYVAPKDVVIKHAGTTDNGFVHGLHHAETLAGEQPADPAVHDIP